MYLSVCLTLTPPRSPDLHTHRYYGEDDDRLGKTLCSFKAGDDEAMVRNKMVKVWIVATSYVPCSLSVVTMFVLLFMTARKVRAFNTTSGMRIRKLVRNTSLYPFITVLLWLPNMICFLVAEWGYPHRPSSEVYWNNIYLPTRLTYCWATLGGFWIALAFFVNSREARHRWRALLWGPAETEGGTSGRRMDGDSLESQPSSPRSGSQRQSSMTSGTGSNYYDSEEDFEGLFEDLDLGSSKLGKSENAKNELIAKVLLHLDKVDFRLNDIETDVLGDAYEYLIGQFASGAGKIAGEFYTPQ